MADMSRVRVSAGLDIREKGKSKEKASNQPLQKSVVKDQCKLKGRTYKLTSKFAFDQSSTSCGGQRLEMGKKESRKKKTVTKVSKKSEK